jgi:hypothetical protein
MSSPKSVKKLSNLCSWSTAAAALAAVGTAMLAGCSPAPAPVAGSRVSPTYRQDTGRLEKLAYDRNGDARDDAWAYMDGTRLLRAELDEDFDGRVDRREFYAAGRGDVREGGTAAVRGLGVLQRVELVSATTGHPFRHETYESGVLAAAEEDTDADGRPDKWERYAEGALTSVALDTRRRGVPDRRLIYTRDGGAPRIETDPDGSGQFRPAAPTQ